MRPFLMCSAMFFWLASALTASAAEPTLTLDVWPDKAPGESGSIGPEKVLDQKPGDKPLKPLTNITHPRLSVFRPAREKDTGAAVVICPGGGYNILAWDLEGEEVAAWLNSIGVTGIVLKYRVPHTGPALIHSAVPAPDSSSPHPRSSSETHRRPAAVA